MLTTLSDYDIYIFKYILYQIYDLLKLTIIYKLKYYFEFKHFKFL